MSDFDYVKHLGKPDSCGAKYTETNPVYCRTATIVASGEGCWPAAPTFNAGAITAESQAEVTSGYSATVNIDALTAPVVKLTCTHSATMNIGTLSGVKRLEISCDYASTIHIAKLEADGVQIYVSYSSRLLMDQVYVERMDGLIDYASFGRSRGRIGTPNVDVRHASTWDSAPIDKPIATDAAVWEQALGGSGASAQSAV